MEVQLIRSGIGDASDQFLSSAILNGEIAVDAGCIGLATPLSVQQRIRHVLLSHSHLDHIASLPIFLDNVYLPGTRCPQVYGSADVWKSLETDLFNGRVWPDLLALSTDESRFLDRVIMEPGVPLDVGGVRVTPVALEHTVPTAGFVFEDGSGAVAFVSDTGPTEAIWRIVNQTQHLRAIFIEASFPSRMTWLAETTMHLTPPLVAEELNKVSQEVPVFVTHLKAAYRQEIEAEFQNLNSPRIEVAVPGVVYRF
jgi:cAMP phosphodiesterase